MQGTANLRPGGAAWVWILALAGSTVLNLVLFGFMPTLVAQRTPAPNERNVVRADPVRVTPPRTAARTKEAEKSPASRTPAPVPRLPPPPLARPLVPVPEFSPRAIAPEVSLPVPGPLEAVPVPDLALAEVALPPMKTEFSSGELDEPPRALDQQPAAYPLRAKRMNVEGAVKVRFLVTALGEVRDPEIVEADPPGLFEDAVLDAVSRWRFSPGLLDGRPVATRVTVSVTFRLE
ncbi:MAG: energy transducer TonB [Proteobacteria bacterium]|nr:energy transducer TonB [Pseudomonadota bacterium]